MESMDESHETFLGCRWSVALLPHSHPLVEEYFPFPASLSSILPKVAKRRGPGEANLDATPLAQDFFASERARQPPPDRSLGKPRSPGPASGANPRKRLGLLSLVRRIHLRLTSPSRFHRARSTNCQSAAVPAPDATRARTADGIFHQLGLMQLFCHDAMLRWPGPGDVPRG